MEWNGVRALVNTFEEHWRQPAERSHARDELRRRTGEDHGEDYAAWHAALRSRLITDVRAALEQMGILDESELSKRSRAPHEFNSLDFHQTLGTFVANADLPNIWLADALDNYLDESLWSGGFIRNVERVTGTRPNVTLTSGTADKPTGIHIEIGRTSGEVSKDPRRQTYQLLCGWAADNERSRRFHLDDGWRAWLLTNEQAAAVQRFRPFAMRAVDPVEPGTSAQVVTDAIAVLHSLRLQVEVDADVIGWDVLEGEPGRVIAQLLGLGGIGVPLRIDDLDDPGLEFFESSIPQLFTDLGKLRAPPVPLTLTSLDEDDDGVEVAFSSSASNYNVRFPPDAVDGEPRLAELGVLLDRMNVAMKEEGSPYRLAAFEARSARAREEVRVVVVPRDRVADLNRVGALLFGTSDCEAPREYEPFKLERFVAVAPSDIVAPDRLFVDDAECVDAPDDYRSIIEELCAITMGEMSLERFSCSETNGRRSLRVTLSGVDCAVDLAGDTDYVDVEPLLSCLNTGVTKLKLKRRFFEFREPGWGQEFGVVFATRAEANKLAKEGFLVK